VRWIISLIVAALFSLAGCGSSGSSTASPDSSPTGVDMDAVFVKLMRQHVDPNHAHSDIELIGLGHRACSTPDAKGVSTHDELISFASHFASSVQSLTPPQAALFIGFSIQTYCPKYSPLVSP
jgi:hypothetical protein